MAYAQGRYPVEAASKIAHMRLLQNPILTSVITQFEATDPAVDAVKGEKSGHVDLTQEPEISHVVTVDGGEVVVPNPIRRDKAVGFINVCTTLFTTEELDRFREDAWLDPRDYARMLNRAQTFHPALLPLAGVSLPHHSVKQTIRTLIDQTLDYAGLYPTLHFLVSREWSPGYVMPGPGSPSMECRHCRVEFQLPRSQRMFGCPKCGHVHTLSDYLGIATDGSDDWSRADAVSQLRDVLETLSIFTVIRGLYGHAQILDRVLLIKDGPLLLRANLYRLCDAIREFLTHLRDAHLQINLVGVEKNGEFADHVAFVRDRLPDPGDFFLPSVEYIVTQIKGGDFPADPTQYRNRVNYGAKLISRVGPDHVLALNIPTGPFLVRPTADDLLGFETIIRSLPRLVSYRFENALMPIVATNAAASLSFNPSGRILEQFVNEMMGVG